MASARDTRARAAAVKTKPAAWREHERMAQADDDEEEGGDGSDAEAAAAPAPATAATDAPEKLEPLREYLVSLGADAGVLDGCARGGEGAEVGRVGGDGRRLVHLGGGAALPLA